MFGGVSVTAFGGVKAFGPLTYWLLVAYTGEGDMGVLLGHHVRLMAA